MTRLWKRSLSLSLGVIALCCLCSLAYVIPVLTTEIDPNLMKGQCPGGKDWDQLGSSCHEGVIVDYMPPVAPVKPSETAQKKKRGR
ncbi:MAG: hypothetical protein QOG23_3380 [Blastocatellia bacterium]|jgi:hypothetical protein|nr:hypothetical protein [Blastocatellia bacterium]